MIEHITIPIEEYEFLRECEKRLAIIDAEEEERFRQLIIDEDMMRGLTSE